MIGITPEIFQDVLNTFKPFVPSNIETGALLLRQKFAQHEISDKDVNDLAAVIVASVAPASAAIEAKRSSESIGEQPQTESLGVNAPSAGALPEGAGLNPFLDPLPQLPASMKNRRQWVRWKLESVGKKTTKVPYQVNGAHASSTNSSTWADYKTVCQAGLIDETQGVGYVVNGDIVGFDLDGCRDPKSQEIAQWAMDIIDTLSSYTEVTPSGTGVRVWVCGDLIGNDRMFKLDPAVGHGDKVQIEVYNTGRYFTATGKSLSPAFGSIDVETRDLNQAFQLVRQTREQHPAPRNEKAEAADNSNLGGSGSVKVEQIGTLGSTKYNVYMNGIIESTSPFVISDGLWRITAPSPSEADLSLCTVLAMMHGDDADAIWNEYTESALVRPKWLEREKYFRECTITKAVETAKKITKDSGVTLSPPSSILETPEIEVPKAEIPRMEDIESVEIPEFDDSVINGIYREIVDAACVGTTLQRQFAFLAAKTYIGALVSGKISFEGADFDSSYYATAIGATGTGKGFAWQRVVEQICNSVKTLTTEVKIIHSADSGAGLKDSFFDDPKDAPIICYVDEIASLGHKTGEKKQPEILDTIIELANRHVLSRTLASRGKGKATRTHDNARLSLYLCGQDGEVIMQAFAGRTRLGIYERLYPEYGAPVVAGKKPRIDSDVAQALFIKISKLPKTGEITMAPGVDNRLEAFWGTLPNAVQARVRLKNHLQLDMFMSAYGRGSMVAEHEDLDIAIKIFQRQLVIRDKCFTAEVPDKVGLYLARLKAITNRMRQRLNAGEPIPKVAMSVRDFQNATNAFRDNELHTFQVAWTNWGAQVSSVKVKGKNGQEYKKFVPEPDETDVWAWE